jgi:predicted nucleic acid-binding protein
MILVDTSTWIRASMEPTTTTRLAAILNAGLVLGHHWVKAELRLGNLDRQRRSLIELYSRFQFAPDISIDELNSFVAAHRLSGSGIGLTDVQLLASARVMGAQLWTQDKALVRAASKLRCQFVP